VVQKPGWLGGDYSGQRSERQHLRGKKRRRKKRFAGPDGKERKQMDSPLDPIAGYVDMASLSSTAYDFCEYWYIQCSLSFDSYGRAPVHEGAGENFEPLFLDTDGEGSAVVAE
jgi:hypothetical protein